MNVEFSENEMSLFLKALAYAARQHRDQRRKGNEQAPYINHLVDVTDLLWRVGGVRDITVLTAGLLHDTIEDTGTTADEIEQLFGREVRDVVLEVTDDKSLPKEERKRLQVLHAADKSLRAQQVKLADKISNVRDILTCPPGGWREQRCQEYLEWAAAVVSGLRGANPALEAEFDRVEARGRQGKAEC